MAVMARISLVFNVRGVNGDSASFFFRRLVNLVVVGKFGSTTFSKNLRDGSSQSRLSVVDMAFITVNNTSRMKQANRPIVPMFM